jgi:hypothetical protein
VRGIEKQIIPMYLISVEKAMPQKAPCYFMNDFYYAGYWLPVHRRYTNILSLIPKTD